MKKPIFLLVVLFVQLSCFSQESVTIATYYPAPSGVYKRLSSNYLTFNSQSTAPATPAIGTLYWDSGPGQGEVAGFYYWDGLGWNLLGGVGGGSLWTELDGDIYREDGKVGIGTTSPQAPLHIASSGNTQEIIQTSSDSQEPYLIFERSKGNLGVPTDVKINDGLGRIAAKGYYGGAWYEAASIDFDVNGYPTGPNDMAGKITFRVSDESSGNPNTAMVIRRNGQVNIGLDSWGRGTALLVNKSVTADAILGDKYADGVWIDTNLLASANNSVLTGLRVSPHFYDNSYSGVKHYGLVVESSDINVTGGSYRVDGTAISSVIWKGVISGFQSGWGTVQIPVNLVEGKICRLRIQARQLSTGDLLVYEGAVAYKSTSGAMKEYFVFNAALDFNQLFRWNLDDAIFGGSWSHANICWLGDSNLTSAGAAIAPWDTIHLGGYQGWEVTIWLIQIAGE